MHAIYNRLYVLSLSFRPSLFSLYFVCFFMERKGKEEYLYSAIIVRTHTLKALRHGSHSFTCKLHHACLSFVSVYQMTPPLTDAADTQLQLTTHLSTLQGWKAELARLVDLQRMAYHISGHPSATGRAQDSESSSAKDRRHTVVPCNQPQWGWGLGAPPLKMLNFLLEVMHFDEFSYQYGTVQ